MPCAMADDFFVKVKHCIGSGPYESLIHRQIKHVHKILFQRGVDDFIVKKFRVLVNVIDILNIIFLPTARK